MRKEGVVWKIFNALVIVMGLLLILGPVWVIFINSMKTMQEAGQDFFALPSRLNFDNYVELFTRSDFWSSLRNSVIVTVSSVALVVIFVPALAYAVARNMEKRYYKILLLTSTGEEFGREGDNILNEIFSSCYEILIWMNTECSSASLADSVKNSIMQRIRRQNDALCKAIELNHDLWVILTSYGTKEEVSEFVSRLLEGNSQQIDICIGISSIGHGVRNLQEYHKQAIYALSGRILYPEKKVLYFDELNNRMNYRNIWNPPKLKKLKTYLIAGEGEKAFSFIRISIQELLKIKDISIYSVIDALKMVEIVLNEAIFHIYQNSSTENAESPVLFSTHFELIHYSTEDGLMADIKEKISKMCNLASLIGEKDAENTVQMVIDYIRLNYNNDITLKDLAENVFFLNGSYLSHLLKIKTGKNYLTYLTEIRMEKAEELLRESEMTVTEIAGLCGYNDISKFIQVFKKYYGKTPKRYREDADTKDTI